MSVDMLDIADVLRAADVPVVEEGDWQHRGTGGYFDAQSIMVHHDASPPGSSSGSADYIIDNQLSQLWLSYSGVWHVIAAGRMNHAGKGSWPGVPDDNANATFIGLETDHTTNEQWTGGQRQYGIRGLVALADWLGIRDSLADLERHLIGHKEWAPSRKVDPDPLDMDDLRAVILNPPTPEEGPVKRIQKYSDEVRELVSGQWRGLKLSDDDDAPAGLWALAVGPADWFEAKAEVYLQGPAGAEVLLRMFRDDGDGNTLYQYPIRSFTIGPAGTAHVELACAGNLPDDQWLRLRGKTGGPEVTISYSGCRVAAW